ncbi:MAG: chorion class high-cysteine HCB protein 13 [Clostridia bacterium]|nr:chorion class high-cysteine HCB protein 13 [Clostridia bacterium]
MNFFGMGDNCCLWVLIILLIVCLCGNGCLSGIIDKICNCGCLLPVLLVLVCCCKGDKGGMNFGFGCK